MPSARITQTFFDGTEFEVELTIDEDFPDACAEVRAQAMHLWREAFAADAEVSGE